MLRINSRNNKWLFAYIANDINNNPEMKRGSPN